MCKAPSGEDVFGELVQLSTGVDTNLVDEFKDKDPEELLYDATGLATGVDVGSVKDILEGEYGAVGDYVENQTWLNPDPEKETPLERAFLYAKEKKEQASDYIEERGEKIEDAITPDSIESPDPSVLAKEQAEINRYDVDTPFGTVRWTQDEQGKWKQTLDLSPEIKGLFDSFLQKEAFFSTEIPTTPNFSAITQPKSGDFTLPDVPSFSEYSLSPEDYEIGSAPVFDTSKYDTSDLTDAEFQLAISYLQPEMEKRQKALEQRLANMGLPLGSEAYTDEFGLLYEAEDEAKRRAAWEAVGKGKEEQERLFKNELASYLADITGTKTQYDIESDITDAEFRNALTGYGSQTNKILSEYGIASDIYDDELQALLAEHGTGIDVFNAALLADQQNFNQLITMLSGAPQANTQPIDVITPYQMQQNIEMFNQAQQNQFWNNILSSLGMVGAAAARPS